MLSIAFDCDGTLVDSEPLHNRADITVLAAAGIVLDPQEHLRRSTGVGRAVMLGIIEREHGITLPRDIQEQIETELQRLVAEELQPIPSVLHVLTVLAQRGARMAVASNSHAAYIEQALQTCGLRSFFGNRIASADDVAHLKPAPDIYLHAARLLETPAQQCIAVEDSLAGVTAARAAGMRAIAFCPPGHVFSAPQLKDAGANEVIEDFAHLLTLLQ